MSGYLVYCRNPHGRTGAAQPIRTHGTFGRALFHLNACYRRYGSDGSGDIYGIATIPSDEETTVQIRTGHPHPIAYTYEADHHCPTCAAARFGVDENGSIPSAATDGEGNPVGAVSPWDEWIEPSEQGVQVLTCGTCGAEIDRYEDVDEIERVDEVTTAYVACALWASIGDDGEPLDDVYTVDDVADEARATMRAEVADFLGLVAREGINVSEIEASQIGHDFWLTRNGHGAGFWDRGLGELGDKLTTCAESFGTSDLYVGDDGSLYVTP